MSRQTPEEIAQQIARFQQKQMELARQTAAELDMLKDKLASSVDLEEEKRPLLDEIQFLRSLLKEHEQEKRILEHALKETQDQLQQVLREVKRAINLPVDEHPAAPYAPHVIRQEYEEPAYERIEPVKKVKKEKPKASIKLPKVKLPTTPKVPLRKVNKKTLVRAAASTAFVLLVYVTWNNSPFKNADTGEVAGVTTQASIPQAAPKDAVTMPTYDESFNDVPFQDTEWEESRDPAFGVSIEVPKNATNRIGAVAGNNIWFLRKSGYILKLTREEWNGTLDEWMMENKETYEAENTLTKTSFKDSPAWLAQPLSRQDGLGYQYFTLRSKTLYTVWVKNESPDTDDGQRIARMVTSLKFLDTN